MGVVGGLLLFPLAINSQLPPACVLTSVQFRFFSRRRGGAARTSQGESAGEGDEEEGEEPAHEDTRGAVRGRGRGGPFRRPAYRPYAYGSRGYRRPGPPMGYMREPHDGVRRATKLMFSS